MCDCVKKLETDIKEKCQKNYKKPIESVWCSGSALSLSDWKTKFTTAFEVRLEGQKKVEKIYVRQSHCPFCGEKSAQHEKAGMEKKTFEAFVKEKGKELKPWQKEAADALLAVMHDNRVRASGKTFLIQNLSEFIDLHGDDFEV